MLDEQNAEGCEARLSRLFAEYREAVPDPEPSARFVPGLWERIDARRSFAHRLKRLSQAFVTAAVAVCLLMGLYLARPEPSTETYLEVLAADQSHDNTADVEIVRAVHDNNP
jgi:hypothetical protein